MVAIIGFVRVVGRVVSGLATLGVCVTWCGLHPFFGRYGTDDVEFRGGKVFACVCREFDGSWVELFEILQGVTMKGAAFLRPQVVDQRHWSVEWAVSRTFGASDLDVCQVAPFLHVLAAWTVTHSVVATGEIEAQCKEVTRCQCLNVCRDALRFIVDFGVYASGYLRDGLFTGRHGAVVCDSRGGALC
jgi:hypothetical protein